MRLRRHDYWNSAHVMSNYPAKNYRWISPGGQNGAHLQKLDEAVGTSPFSVRYYQRDRELHTRDRELLPSSHWLACACCCRPHRAGRLNAAATLSTAASAGGPLTCASAIMFVV